MLHELDIGDELEHEELRLLRRSRVTVLREVAVSRGLGTESSHNRVPQRDREKKIKRYRGKEMKRWMKR